MDKGDRTEREITWSVSVWVGIDVGSSQLIFGCGSLTSSRDGVRYVNSWSSSPRSAFSKTVNWPPPFRGRIFHWYEMQKRERKCPSQEELEWCKPLAWVPRTRSGNVVPLVQSAEGYMSLQHYWEKYFERTWTDVSKKLCGSGVNWTTNPRNGQLEVPVPDQQVPCL